MSWEEAVALFQGGDLAGTERLCLEILKQAPDDFADAGSHQDSKREVEDD